MKLLTAMVFVFAAARFAAAENEAGFEVSGFLYESPGGTWVSQGEGPWSTSIEKLLGLEPGGCCIDSAFPSIVDLKALPDVRMEKHEPDFGPWLRGVFDRKDLPRDWVRLRVASTGRAGEFRYRIDEVLGRDKLSTEWLEAWRELDRVNQGLARTVMEDPSAGKREAIAAFEPRLRDATLKAREARSKGDLRHFQAWRERVWEKDSAGLLRRMGEGESLPHYPTAFELGEIFLASAGRDAFRDVAIRNFGGDVSIDSLWIVILAKTAPGDRPRAEGKWIRLEEAFAMPVAEFEALRQSALAVTEEQRRLEGAHGPFVVSIEDELDLDAIGARVTQLTVEECRRFGIPGGARIVKVTAGGTADKAGLKTGDVVWKYEFQAEGGLPGSVGEDWVLSPLRLETALEHRATGRVKIFRGSEALERKF